MMATQVQVRSVCRSLNACRFALNASAATFNRDYSYGVHARTFSWLCKALPSSHARKTVGERRRVRHWSWGSIDLLIDRDGNDDHLPPDG